MKEFRKISLLGCGLGGEVWACLDKDGQLCAVKFFKQDLVSSRREVDNALALNHPNIIHPLSYSLKEDNAYMVMPYLEGRSVDNIAGYVNEKTAWKLILDIASALDYMHCKGMCHADVKPSNILYGGESFLLGDLGSCFGEGEKPLASDKSSYQFCAPEKKRSFGSDIWSLGASVFYLVMGVPVFGGLGGRAQKGESDIPIMRKSMPELSGCVKRCLDYSPKMRPSAAELMALAREQLARCQALNLPRPLKAQAEPSVTDANAAFWPETMTDTL